MLRRCAHAAATARAPEPAPGDRCVRVVGSSKRWPEAFPQHGPGRKHERKIELAAWQREIVDRFPQEFLRGLLHSDGCRTVNRFKTTLPSGRVAEYAYPRWFFSNRSAEIRALFCEYCERLGVRWTQSNPRNISVPTGGASRFWTRSCRSNPEYLQADSAAGARHHDADLVREGVGAMAAERLARVRLPFFF